MKQGDILLFDIGNSRVKWAWLTGGIVHHVGGAAHREADWRAAFESANAGGLRPVRVLASNVAGREFAESLTDWTGRHWQVQPKFVSAQAAAYGVTNAYHDPMKLGSDRWVALVGAHYYGAGPACIVDCGTALTIDALTADGQHLGGLILPGLTMMRRVLPSNTQGIAFTISATEETLLTPFARTTQHAVAQGSLYAQVAAIDRAVKDMMVTLGAATRIVTGGDAPLILPHLVGSYRHEPHWILKSLAIITNAGETR